MEMPKCTQSVLKVLNGIASMHNLSRRYSMEMPQIAVVTRYLLSGPRTSILHESCVCDTLVKR